MKSSDSKPLFTLSVAAEIMGVHPRTLMIYESEGLVVPARTKTNRRRFSQKDIKKLQFVRYLTNKKGVNLAGVAYILKITSLTEKNGLSLLKPVFPSTGSAFLSSAHSISGVEVTCRHTNKPSQRIDKAGGVVGDGT